MLRTPALSEIGTNSKPPRWPHVRWAYRSASIHSSSPPPRGSTSSCLTDAGHAHLTRFGQLNVGRRDCAFKKHCLFCSSSLRMCPGSPAGSTWMRPMEQTGIKPVAWLQTQLRSSELPQPLHKHMSKTHMLIAERYSDFMVIDPFLFFLSKNIYYQLYANHSLSIIPTV